MNIGLVPLNATISVKRSTQDEWGIDIPNGEEKFYRVRVDYDIEEAKLSVANGSERVISGAVLFVGEVDMSDGDILGIDGKEFHPISIKPLRDFGGNVIHTRVLF
ncbi:hypothetical protein MOD91_18170 [Bacillus haynesii]|uniref:hypothetical protein n=1 Tax=Bacillus haynesii TaxID=1925021 RepID=UPI00097B1178|nr:hypothetical protein [Bacillus haynesii]MCY8048451.1 hypothetical protein [Bacillus haynesii]MCY8668789.1 hypothetical protein [Bacillus haynesii]MCY9324072.1 hypothetical protein [Bacillus haynesii]OMI07717.1 hypothetical protein BVL54_20045 [Bacillus paralicheniformis]